MLIRQRRRGPERGRRDADGLAATRRSTSVDERTDRTSGSISETAGKTHVTRFLQKLGLRDRVQVVVLAYHAGLSNQDVRAGQPDGRSAGAAGER